MQALESLTDSQVGEVSGVRIREVSYPPPPHPTHTRAAKRATVCSTLRPITLYLTYRSHAEHHFILNDNIIPICAHRLIHNYS